MRGAAERPKQWLKCGRSVTYRYSISLADTVFLLLGNKPPYLYRYLPLLLEHLAVEHPQPLEILGILLQFHQFLCLPRAASQC
jgi:hypothetical protein